MKILIVVPSYKPAFVYGGPINSISYLGECLVKAGVDVTVYTTTANGDKELDVKPRQLCIVDGVKVFYYPRLTKGHSNISAALLRSIYDNALNFDVVHIQAWWNLVSIPATWICLMKGVVPIISPRGTLTSFTFENGRKRLKGLFHRIYGRRLLGLSVLVFTSERERVESIRFIGDNTNYVIPNLLDLPQRFFIEHQETTVLKLIFLGRIDPAKNLELLFLVLDQISEFPYELAIVGEGPVAYKTKLQQLTFGKETIRWIGPLSGDEKFKWLAAADLLILPSHTENFGNVVFEALSQGTAVVVSSNVGAKEFILTRDLGWVVDGGIQAWKESLVNIWNDRIKRDEIRQRAPGIIAKEFDGSIQVKDYIKMYEGHLSRYLRC